MRVEGFNYRGIYTGSASIYINTLSRSDRYHADFLENENRIFQMPNKQLFEIARKELVPLIKEKG